MNKELHKVNAILRGSSLENEALGGGDPGGVAPQRFMNLLDTKVEISDLEEKLKKKMNKHDSDMIFRQIS